MTPEQQGKPTPEEQQDTEEQADTAAPAAPAALPHQPGVSPGSVDITGIVPEGIRIDPDITEGHPGYEESGESEIIPPERLAAGGTETPTRSN
ncbi:MAG TPA: hypothetical protein VNK04_08530 [Gemmataceae bacterium]|nr:hypothetical protein [Gemmataceae bacterium]